ncbi:hypothetical protein niasHT_009472 [Heterodera trifolii]|uniref:Trehalase n=1 Tax=Heterodera trifolii TaxID=157864 RepID=A0ABD2MER7_9BILA
MNSSHALPVSLPLPWISSPPIHRLLSSFVCLLLVLIIPCFFFPPRLIFPKMSFLCPLSSSRFLFVLSLLLSLPSPLSSKTYYLKKPFEGRFKTEGKAEKENEWECHLDSYDLSKLDLNRTCDENDKDMGQIFCYGKILEAINYFGKSTMFKGDPKHIVDRPLIKSAEETVEDFKTLFGVKEWMNVKVRTLDRAKLKKFVREHFGKADDFLDSPKPVDWKENPPKLQNIADPQLKTFANQLHDLWKELGKKMPDSAKEKKSTLIYVPNPFVVPGGRFREFYYWDAYWIVRGLLASGMTESVKHMCDNYAEMVNKFGFVPNGGRIYYNKRSQPPFLTFMVNDYFAETGDTEYLKTILPVLEKELQFWRSKRSVQVNVKERLRTFYQYRAESNVPRPESFCQDVDLVKDIPNLEEKKRIWNELASAAESGWDFSSRWIEEDTNEANEALKWKLTRLMITKIVPVDLNALICGNLEMLSNLYHQIGDKGKANKYHKEFQAFREDVHDLFYDKGGWFDYNLKNQTLIKRFYGSIVVPLFARCYHTADVEETEKILSQLEEFDRNNKIMSQQFGVPTSAIASGQQWDFPNIWPPLAHMLIEGLRRSGIKRMEDKARDLAQKYVSANHELFNQCGKHMFEKTTADEGAPGKGGEYTVQIGFGWTNGAILDLLVTYGKEMKLDSDFPKVNCYSKEVDEEPDVFPT